MLIREVAGDVDQSRLMALVDFLSGRADDVDAKKTISGQAFVNLANQLKIPLTITQLKTLSQQAPLNNLIANIEGPDNDPEAVTITFRGGETVTDTMTVDQARLTVDQMAKRALK
jgi:hypothetical protein